MVDDFGVLFREVLGAVALFSAGWQLTVRIAWVMDKKPGHRWRSREIASGLTTFLLLYGVAWAQLAHRYAPITGATIIIAAGVVTSIWSNLAITKAVEKDDTHET